MGVQKHAEKEETRNLDSIKRRVRKFWSDHPDLDRDIDGEFLYAFKDGEEFTIDDFKTFLANNNITDLGGLTACDLLKYR